MSTKQITVVMSTTDAVVVSLTNCVKMASYFNKFLGHLKINVDMSLEIAI